MSDKQTTNGSWRSVLDERQRKAVAFAENYVANFNHGTVGHNDLVLIARLAQLLDQAAAGATFEQPDRMDIPLGFGKYRPAPPGARRS